MPCVADVVCCSISATTDREAAVYQNSQNFADCEKNVGEREGALRYDFALRSKNRKFNGEKETAMRMRAPVI